ncbi:MAG: tetratricopeptide repeat protein [Acidobacteriota bacterium]
MSLRSLLTLLAVFVVVVVGLWVVWLNQDSATLRLPGFPPMEFETKLWVVSFLSLLVGVFGTLLYSAVLSSREALSRWRLRRRERRAAEVTQVFQSGLQAAARGDHKKALKSFETAIEIDPSYIDAWLQAGDAARNQGELEQAVDMHMRARGMAPDDPRVQEALAADFESQGEYGRAVTHLRQRIAADPKGEPQNYAWLRDLLVRQGCWLEAQEVQQKRLKLLRDPLARADEEAILRGLQLEQGRSLLEQDERDGPHEAAEIFRSLIKADPQFVPAYLLLGKARLADGDAEGAVQGWQAGIEATRSVPLLDHLVNYYLESGQPESAIKAYRRATERIEGQCALAARLGLALLYSRLEMLEEAQAEFERSKIVARTR